MRKLMGIATLVLGGGDAFHLVPRVLNYWMTGDFTAALGIGKFITSVTMTVLKKDIMKHCGYANL